MEEHHTNIIQSLTASADNIQGASAFCGFDPREVLRTTSPFEHEVNFEATDLLKKFYFSRQKLLRNKWHAITLSEYIRKEMIPRGLRILKPPSFGKDNPAFITAWNSVLNKCSFALMAITIQYLNEEEGKLQNETLKDEQHLETLARENKEVLKQMEDIDIKLTAYENEIKGLKKDKFLRDEKDYKKGYTYPWCKQNHNSTLKSTTAPEQHQTHNQQKLKTHTHERDYAPLLQIRRRPNTP